jgi:hypothetical protein
MCRDPHLPRMRLKEIAAPEMFRKGAKGLKLFAGGGSHPDDINGSSNGLLVAAACLANKPGAVEQVRLGAGMHATHTGLQAHSSAAFNSSWIMPAPLPSRPPPQLFVSGQEYRPDGRYQVWQM